MRHYYVEYEDPNLGNRWCTMEGCSASEEQDKADIKYTVEMYGKRVLCIEKLIDSYSSQRV